MATATVTEFLSLLPEFAVTDSGNDRIYPDTDIQGWLDAAQIFYNRRKQGMIYVAGHLIVLAKAERPGPGPAVVDVGLQSNVESESIGPLSVRYRQEAREDHDAFFSRSTYGRMFIEMEKRSPWAQMSMRSW